MPKYTIKVVTTVNQVEFKSDLSATDIRDLINNGDLINFQNESEENVNLFVHPNQLVTITDRVLITSETPTNVELFGEDGVESPVLSNADLFGS